MMEDSDWWLLLKPECVLFVIPKQHCGVTLPLRPAWATASPVPNPGMCEELQNLKWPQNNHERCAKPPRHIPPLQSANTVTEARMVFKVTAFLFGVESSLD